MKHSSDVIELLRVLGDSTRLRLLVALRQGELTVGEITRVTGLSQPRVSRHLKLLCDAEVLQRTRDQNEVYYRATLDDDHGPLVNAALSSLPDDDPQMLQDNKRLTQILEDRQVHARVLLSELGVLPLNSAAMSDVGRTVEKLLHSHIRSADKKGSSVGDLLDVGTGTGSMLGLIAPHARTTVAVDRSRDMRLVARARASLEGLTNCTVQDGDMYALSFPQNSFDMVTMDRVLGTADRPEDAIQQAALVLRDDGHLLVVETRGSMVDDAKLGSWAADAGLTPVATCKSGDGAATITLAARTAAAKEGIPHEL
jgi:DNA-binding transcriptional ArsR family regulator